MFRIIFFTVIALAITSCSSTKKRSTQGDIAQLSVQHHNDDDKGWDYFPKNRNTGGEKVFIFSPKATAWAAYDSNGELIKTGRASGGRHYCSDVGRPCRTTVGRYRVHTKRGADCKSSKFPLGEGGAPMPHCNFFNGGYAVHGSYYVPNHNASHGCVRVTPSAAAWLDNNFLDIGTKVIVEPY